MAYRRIHSKGPYQYDEAQAGGTVTPGMLVKLNTSGYVIAHDEEGGRGEVMFAVEDALQGASVTDNYASGEQAGYIIPGKGSEVCALIAASETLSIGDEVVSAGDGTLKARGSSGSGVTEWQTIGYMMEAVAAPASNTLYRVRVA